MARKKMFSMAVIIFGLMVIFSEKSDALTNQDLAGKTWLFQMEVAQDGLMYDVDTVMLDGRWTKTQMKELLKEITVGTPISYANISVFRLKIEGVTDDWTVIVYFDKAGYSLYGYTLPTQISEESE